MQEKKDLIPRLNDEQKTIYDLIINANTNNRQELIFVYGHGGTGKTFLWKTIIGTLRSESKIVLAVASSGIASLLLPSGRNAHSKFKLPLELTEESLCIITKNTHLGKLLVDTDLIIWDEALMNDRRCFEALDKSLRDILNAPSSLFGGKSIPSGGDFQQTLPVKKGASKMEVIASCILSGIISNTDFDVIIQHKDGPAQRINKLHPSYMSLQFPLIFIYGQSGYHTNLKLKSVDGSGKATRVTMLAYYRYQLHFRLHQYDLIFKGGRLFQQYVIGVFCAVEQNWLDFKEETNYIRSDYLSGLYDAIS
ncbi:DNA helicase [Tanacetum coccineum]